MDRLSSAVTQEYVRGMYDENGIMKKFSNAYGYAGVKAGDYNAGTQD